MKKLICIFILLCCMALGVFAESGSGVFDRCSGQSTMSEIRSNWEENGYPNYISYMKRSAAGGIPLDGEYLVVETVGQVFYNGVLQEEYGDNFKAERWEIGVLPGGEKYLSEYLESNLSNICVVNLVQCDYSHEELTETYKKVLKDYCRDLSVIRITIDRDCIILSVSPLTENFYRNLTAKKYGDMVVVNTLNFHSMQSYDENGNMIGNVSPSVLFEIWLILSIFILFLILLIFGIIFFIRHISRKLRK